MRASDVGRRTLLCGLLFCRLPGVFQQDPPTSIPSSAPDLANSHAPSSTANSTSLPDLTPDGNGKLSQEQMQKLFRIVADKDIENQKRQRDYTYIDREVENKLDGRGQTKSTEMKTYEIQ